MPSKRKIADLSVDQFMAEGLGSDEEGTTSGDSAASKQKRPNTKIQRSSLKKAKAEPAKSSKHKAQLSRLAEKDPEFYEFLKGEDKSLLEFSDEEDEDAADDESSDDSVDDAEDNDAEDEEEEDEILKKLENFESDSDDDDDDDAAEKGGRFHKLPARLEVDSDDDAEDDEDVESKEKEESFEIAGESAKRPLQGTKVTKKMVNRWRDSLQTNPTPSVLRKVIMVFRAAVTRTSSKEGEVVKYRVEGHTVFNAIVHLCLTELVPTLHQLLALQSSVDQLQRPVATSCGKKWKTVRLDVKNYLTDLLKLMSQMSEASVLTVLLKHVHRVVPYYACFPKLTKIIMKRLIILWSEGEETVRVMAFLCINRLVRMQQDAMLESTLKQMYLAYVKNTKFTSPSTLPLINFTQRSLVEIFVIDMSIAYQHAFIYIRQLAIHLRNAITVNKKETCQAVYNWQYIHCLELWVKLLSATYPSDIMNPLIYPLTQTIIGTIKLLPTARYYPLRFHCVRMMTSLSAATDTFIPVLPFLLEVFEQTNFNKKHKSLSFKPFNFACILKLSKTQLQEKAFKDGLIDQVYELLLENLNVYSHCISFPELALPTLVQLKSFLKSNKVANYCRQIKQILDKVDETCAAITKRRKTATFGLSDDKAVAAWERQSKDEGTPLSKYYVSWRKLRDRELQHEIAGKERISDMELPTIERRVRPTKASAEERKELSALFNSDDDDDSEDDKTRFLPKGERKAKRKEAGKQKRDNDDDDDNEDYSDFDSDELEQLAQSADESDSDDKSDDKDNENDDDIDIKEEDKDKDDDDESEDDDAVNKADVVKDFSWSDDDD